MYATTRKAILEALKRMDQRQAEKVLAYIGSLGAFAPSKPVEYDRFKRQALRQIRTALRPNALDSNWK